MTFSAYETCLARILAVQDTARSPCSSDRSCYADISGIIASRSANRFVLKYRESNPMTPSKRDGERESSLSIRKRGLHCT
jgi:hypothetical protein